MDCGVCCDRLVGAVCPYCSFPVCRLCTQKYLVGLSGDAQCMGCRKFWDRGVLVFICGKSFLNGVYKSHREIILFERQKPSMPGVQAELTVQKRIKDVYRLMADYRRDPVVSRSERQIAIRQLDVVKRRLCDELYGLLNPGSVSVFKKKNLPVHKCPQSGCKGFLDGSWHCPLCDTLTCRKCNEPVSSGHVCDPGSVASMCLLKKDTKGCPTCGTMIFRISGCSQMWCPGCHTAFDWHSLSIETSVIHNPHYFEYMRQQGGGQMARQPGDACGVERLPPYISVLHVTDDAFVTSMYRTVAHWDYVVGRRERVVDVRPLTVRYMSGRWSEYQYRVALQRHEKHRLKVSEYFQVHQMFVSVSIGLFHGLVSLRSDPDVFKVEISALLSYANRSLLKVGELYESKAPLLSQSP